MLPNFWMKVSYPFAKVRLMLDLTLTSKSDTRRTIFRDKIFKTKMFASFSDFDRINLSYLRYLIDSSL